MAQPQLMPDKPVAAAEGASLLWTTETSPVLIIEEKREEVPYVLRIYSIDATMIDFPTMINIDLLRGTGTRLGRTA